MGWEVDGEWGMSYENGMGIEKKEERV